MKYDICYVTISPLRHERRNNNQMRLVMEMGLRAVIFALWEPGLAERETIYSTDVIRLKIKHPEGGKRKFLEFNRQIYLALKKIKFDILHMHELWVLPGCFPFLFHRKFKSIYDAHEFFTGLKIFNTKKFSLFIWYLVEKLSMPYMDALITVCEPHRRLYVKKYPSLLSKKTLHILNVPEHHHLKESDNDQTKNDQAYIVFQGLFRPGRGLPELIQAMQYVDNIELHLYGYGELTNQLTELISDLHLDDKVILKGKFDPEQIVLLIRNASAGVVLFEADSINYRYAMPNKFFEYIQAGIPVLASNLQTFRSILIPYGIGIISESLDPKILATKINQVVQLKNQTSYKEKSAIASTIFSWDNEKHKLAHLYSTFLK